MDFSKTQLTSKQRQLVKEIDSLLAELGLDPEVIIQESTAADRTSELLWARTHLVRGTVITYYTLFDDALGLIVSADYFGKKQNYRQLRKTKRWKSFNFFILEKLSFLHKLDYIKNAYPLPRWVTTYLHDMNDLRNGVAHSFRTERRKRKPEWKHESIFTNAGLTQYLDDMSELLNFFAERFFGGPLEEFNIGPTDRPERSRQKRGTP